MHAEIEWVDEVHFAATADSGHTVLLDGPPEGGGSNRGARPMELMLMAIGGCSAYDVVSILSKSRQAITGCRAEVRAERAESIPHLFERIHLRFIVTGHDLNHAKVARAVALSADKYCSASIMMSRAGAVVTHDYEVRQEA